MRPSGRKADELRPVSITRNYTCHAEGSVIDRLRQYQGLVYCIGRKQGAPFPAGQW